LGVEGTQVAKQLQMSQPGVAYAVRRGERIVKAKAMQMIE
jgi:DNA-binding transcriptional LysR family regulator